MFDLVYPQEPAQVLPRPSAIHSEKRRMKGEMVPVVEQSGLVVGQTVRSYVHGGSKLLHPVVHLHIINHEGELYIQRRSLKKDLLPGRWDTAVGGHVDYGEYLEEALYREAHEELGLYDFNPVFLATYVFESEVEKELVNVFATIKSSGITPDPEEVIEGRFWKRDEIEDSMWKGIFTPNFEMEYEKIKQSLYALL